jgi:D-arginine dehydrogenase
MLTIATPGMEGALAAHLALSATGQEIVSISTAEALALAPLLRPERVVAATYEPAVDFAGADAYFKPSPGDQTPVEPQDIQPDEWDMAVVADWLQTETTIQIRRIGTSWAGLRSFVEDQNPVVKFDPDVEGFFWLAAQGGYGIMMAPTLAKAATGLSVT